MVLGQVADGLESGVAIQFAEEFDVEVKKLQEYFELPVVSDVAIGNLIVIPGKWDPDYVDENDDDGIFAKAIVATNRLCTEAPVSQENCETALAEVNKLAVLAGIARKINSTYVSLEFDKSKAISEKFVSRFDKLQAAAPFQYPWELAINRRFLNCNLANSNRNRYENTAGTLTSLPGCNFVVLHPDAGFGFSSDAPEGSQSTGALILELGGFVINRFKTNEDLQTWGASISATLADLEGNNNDLGLGVTLRYKKLALTVSSHDDLTFVFLNMELFDSFGRSNKAYEGFRQEH